MKTSFVDFEDKVSSSFFSVLCSLFSVVRSLLLPAFSIVSEFPLVEAVFSVLILIGRWHQRLIVLGTRYFCSAILSARLSLCQAHVYYKDQRTLAQAAR